MSAHWRIKGFMQVRNFCFIISLVVVVVVVVVVVIVVVVVVYLQLLRLDRLLNIKMNYESSKSQASA